MGEQNLTPEMDEASLRRFTYRLIEDVRALEYLLEENKFESGACAESGWNRRCFWWMIAGVRPPVAEQVLERVVDDDRVVAELMKFNLELNLDPVVFRGDCLRRMERSVEEAVASVRKVVEEVGAHVVLAGILPTITLSDLDLVHMMPAPRYYALNEAIARLRGGPAELQIRGTDELYIKHDSITLEGCNTSFQTHLQVHPDEFAAMYNIAQAATGPVLAAAVNSPTFFGKRLWQETRIALFQAGCGYAQFESVHPGDESARAFRNEMDRPVGAGNFPGRHFPVPDSALEIRDRRSYEGAGSRGALRSSRLFNCTMAPYIVGTGPAMA